MARGRLLANTLSTSEKFNALYAHLPTLADFCQLLYVMLVPHADDRGRFPGDARTVRLRVLPCSPHGVEEFDTALTALAHVGLIHRYAIEARQFLAITQFEVHQVFKHPPQSALPAPPDCPQGDPTVPDVAHSAPHVSPSVHWPGGDTQGAWPPKEVKEVKEVKKDARGRARRVSTSIEYLADCTHTPPCETPRLCGERRRIEAAVRDKVLALEQAERLVGLLIADRQPLRAPRRSRQPGEGS